MDSETGTKKIAQSLLRTSSTIRIAGLKPTEYDMKPISSANVIEANSKICAKSSN